MAGQQLNDKTNMNVKELRMRLNEITILEKSLMVKKSLMTLQIGTLEPIINDTAIMNTKQTNTKY